MTIRFHLQLDSQDDARRNPSLQISGDVNNEEQFLDAATQAWRLYTVFTIADSEEPTPS